MDDVDGEVENVDQEDGEHHGAVDDIVVLTVGAEEGANPTDNLACPSEEHERSNCRQGAAEDERTPLAPGDPAVVTLQTDVGLHEDTGERTGDPDESKHGLAEAEGQKVGLRKCISILDVYNDGRIHTEPLDVSTDQPIWRPRPPRVKRKRKKLLFVSSNSGK